jgi:SAM-dependent methyltransferase
MTANQDELHNRQCCQDKMWDYYQTFGVSRFDLSYPRLLFLSELFSSGQRVLNIGVGSGYLEEKLLQRGVDVHALDPSEKAISLLRERLALGDKAKTAHGNHIPFTGDYFEGVVMTEVLEHLSEDVLQGTLDEVYRVLRPGGLFVGTVPNKEDLNSNHVFCPSCEAVFHLWGHCQRFDRERMNVLLNKKGFHVIKIQCRTFPDWRRPNPRLLLKSVVRYILGRLGEPLVSPNLYFKARKTV